MTTAPPRPLPAADAAAGYLRRRERGENFPVALRLLPAALRADLRAIYDVARTIDDIGDADGSLFTEAGAGDDRAGLLTDFGADLDRIWDAGCNGPRHPVLRRLAPTVRAHGLSAEPFHALLAANLLDQRRSSYPTWDDLRHYCSLSAEPVGRLVLGILAAATPQRVDRSDDVCTALQLLEHCQDVAEDRRRGRTYLPLADLRAYGVSRTDLDAPAASYAVRRLVAGEVDRAAALLAAGRPLVRSLAGAGRWAVAGYVAGGLATVDALRRYDFDVLGAWPGARQPRRSDIVRHAIGLAGGR